MADAGKIRCSNAGTVMGGTHSSDGATGSAGVSGQRAVSKDCRSAIGVFLLGLSLEYLQHLIYRNPMEWRDVRDDTLAILAAFALYQFARWRAGGSMPPVGPA